MVNQHIRPSFEEVETYAGVYYSAVGASLIERATVAPPGPASGVAYGLFTSNRVANIQLNTPVPEAAGGAWFIPAVATEVWSVGLDVIWVSGTPKDVRIDIGFGDASNVWVYQNGTEGNGGRVNPAPTGAYVRLVNEGFTCPAGKDRVRIRIVVLNAIETDQLAFDRFQIEQGVTLPAYNEQTPPVTPVLVHRWTGMGVVSAKTTDAASVRLKVADDAAMTINVRFTADVVPDADGWSKHNVTATTSGFYQVEMTNAGNDVFLDAATGSFWAPPAVGLPATFALTAGSCSKSNQPFSPLAWDGMRTRSDSFVVQLGDFGYPDNPSDQQSSHRANIETTLTDMTGAAQLIAERPMLYLRSDHDSGGNSNDPGPHTAANIAAYKQIVPHGTLVATDGLYWSFVVGRVRFIVSDLRSLRSPRAATDDASKSMLGVAQKAWLKDRLLDPEPLKVWFGDGPFIGENIDNMSDDSWERYTTERTELGNFVQANGVRLIYVHGDQHAICADDGSNNVYGGFASVGCAPIDRPGSFRGGPWSHGRYHRGDTVLTQQYGVLSFTDTTDQIVFDYAGYDAADEVAGPKVSMSLIYDLSTYPRMYVVDGGVKVTASMYGVVEGGVRIPASVYKVTP